MTSKYRDLIGAAIFLALLIFIAFYGAYCGNNHHSDSVITLGGDNKAEPITWIELTEALSAAITAVFTLVLGVSTIKLWKSTENIAKINRSQIDLARNEYLATHRPKLLIQFVRYSHSDLRHVPASIYYVIVNVGESEARVVETCVYPYTQGEDESFLPYLNQAPCKYPENLNIKSGQSVSVSSECATADWEFGGDRALFVVGYIIYMAADNIMRRTGFCRIFDESTFSLHVINDSEYEYAY